MDIKKELEDALKGAGSLGKLSESAFENYALKYANATKSDDLKEMISGKIFTFYYDSPLNKELGFINRRPILFIEANPIDVQQGSIKGIDLMLLTPLARFNFLVRLIKVFSKAISNNAQKKEDLIASAQSPLPFTREILADLFKGIKYKHANSGFKIEKIKRLKEVPMDDWKNMIYLNTGSLEGINLEDLYKKYK